MTRNKYLTMMEQLGQEPKDSEIPPDWDDLPEIVIQAVNTFNMLGDRIYPEIGYVGKDYTNLPFYIDFCGVEDVEFFLEILHMLDTRAVKQSSDQIKKMHEKLKRKSSG